jgi:glycosyltransferase involved in cell wall biosynthesis
VELWLAGTWHDAKLKSACEAEPGWQYTRYFGRVGADDVYSMMKVASIGLHVPHDLPNYRMGLAVKAFEYMACKLPFIATDEPAKRKMFADCAVFTRAIDPDSLATAISELLNNSDKRKRLAANGRQMVEGRYNWEQEGQRLVELYGRLLQK